MHFFALTTGRQGVELQQPGHPLPVSAHLHHGHHHAVLPSQRLLQPGKLGSCLLWYHLLHPLPAAHFLLRLARPHHQRHEAPGGGCLKLKACLLIMAVV